MAYSKTTWKDRIVEKPLNYTQTTNGDGTITLTPAPGVITEQGTPLTAANLNKMENGIGDTDSRLTTVEGKYAAGESAGFRFERVAGFFFTNGSSNSATATVTFAKAFNNPPRVMPANFSVAVPYSDTIRYPHIVNVTATQFTVKITTADNNNLGTPGNAANAIMYFLVFGE